MREQRGTSLSNKKWVVSSGQIFAYSLLVAPMPLPSVRVTVASNADSVADNAPNFLNNTLDDWSNALERCATISLVCENLRSRPAPTQSRQPVRNIKHPLTPFPRRGRVKSSLSVRFTKAHHRAASRVFCRQFEALPAHSAYPYSVYKDL